jgi:hypothetical protein
VFAVVTEATAIVVLLIVVVQVLRIGRITGSFRSWNLISLGFALMVVRRLISVSAELVAEGQVLSDYVIPLVSLFTAACFVAAFYELTMIFQRSATGHG